MLLLFFLTKHGNISSRSPYAHISREKESTKVKFKAWVFAGAILLVVVAAAIILYSQRVAGGKVTIGWIGPLTGDAASYGKAIQKGSELAVE